MVFPRQVVVKSMRYDSWTTRPGSRAAMAPIMGDRVSSAWVNGEDSDLPRPSILGFEFYDFSSCGKHPSNPYCLGVLMPMKG